MYMCVQQFRATHAELSRVLEEFNQATRLARDAHARSAEILDATRARASARGAALAAARHALERAIAAREGAAREAATARAEAAAIGAAAAAHATDAVTRLMAARAAADREASALAAAGERAAAAVAAATRERDALLAEVTASGPPQRAECGRLRSMLAECADAGGVAGAAAGGGGDGIDGGESPTEVVDHAGTAATRAAIVGARRMCRTLRAAIVIADADNAALRGTPAAAPEPVRARPARVSWSALHERGAARLAVCSSGRRDSPPPARVGAAASGGVSDGARRPGREVARYVSSMELVSGWSAALRSPTAPALSPAAHVRRRTRSRSLGAAPALEGGGRVRPAALEWETPSGARSPLSVGAPHTPGAAVVSPVVLDAVPAHRIVSMRSAAYVTTAAQVFGWNGTLRSARRATLTPAASPIAAVGSSASTRPANGDLARAASLARRPGAGDDGEVSPAHAGEGLGRGERSPPVFVPIAQQISGWNGQLRASSRRSIGVGSGGGGGGSKSPFPGAHLRVGAVVEIREAALPVRDATGARDSVLPDVVSVAGVADASL